MKSSTIKILAVLVVLVAAGAWAATAFRDSGTRASTSDDAAFPTLVERFNDIGEVRVETKDETMTLRRGADGWTMAEKSGYAVKSDSVMDLLMGLRETRVVEEKTANKDRFDRLGLDAPGAEGSNSKRVVVKSKDGTEIANVLIGDRRASKGGFGAMPGGGSPDQMHYVHPSGDGPALLVAGDLNVVARPTAWMDQQFLNVPRARIKAARVTHAGGETVEVVRPDMESTEPELVSEIPEGKEPKEPSGTRVFLDAIASLRFDDVKPVDEVNFEENDPVVTEFLTEHGLKVIATTIERDKPDTEGVKEVWAKFDFSVDQDDALLAATEEEGGEASEVESGAGEGDEPAGDDGAEQEDDDEEDSGPTLEELRAEATEFEEKTKGWAYALPSWKTRAFRMKLDELVQDIPEPEPAPEPEPEAVDEGGGDGDGDGG